MTIWTKIYLLFRIIRWRLSWGKTYTDYVYTREDNPKFMGVRDAVKLIPDGAMLATSGLGGNQRASVPFWAIRERFESEGHPRDLSLVVIGGHGGRGKVPGTTEELGQEGLVARFFTGHTETFKAMLNLADAGKLELQCLPQGSLALLLAAQARGETSIVTETGLGTFCDPRDGRGTRFSEDDPQYVEPAEGGLKYWIPPIDVAVFNVPAADAKGNLYTKGAAMIGESYEIAKAAKKNGGIVIANVGLLVDEGYDEVFLTADDVDAIVYHPKTEQSAAVAHEEAWDLLTTGPHTIDQDEGIARLRFICNTLRITPTRKPSDTALARLAATIFAIEATSGYSVDIGIGLPEEASRLLYEGGLLNQLRTMNESGVLGGLAAPGIFFGAAVHPDELIGSPEFFRRIHAGDLDSVILGALQVDSNGNVNVSKRGAGPKNYVGPGGFIDLTECADLIVFCTAWSEGGEARIEGEQMKIVKRGNPKFVEQVEEVTFNGQRALSKGKRVYYITHVGAFKLTERGMELVAVMPGIDVQRDIIEGCSMKVVLPVSGDVPLVDPSLITGQGYRLEFGGTPKSAEKIEQQAEIVGAK